MVAPSRLSGTVVPLLTSANLETMADLSSVGCVVTGAMPLFLRLTWVTATHASDALKYCLMASHRVTASFRVNDWKTSVMWPRVLSCAAFTMVTCRPTTTTPSTVAGRVTAHSVLRSTGGAASSLNA